MQYDFETIATAPDEQPAPDDGLLVLSGAQLHVKTAPCIIEALTKRSESGYFGWLSSELPLYIEAVCRWMATARGWEIQPEWVVPSYGTLQAISAVLRAFTAPGDGVIVQPPAYVLYDRVLARTGRKKAPNPLLYHHGRYQMDFDGLEALMRQPENKVMLLCNPHNPLMTVWAKEELATVARMAAAHQVLVVADEIFAEHVFPGTPMTPYASLPDATGHCVVCTSLGKAFNFTGTSHSNVIIPSSSIREQYIIQRNADHYGSLSPFMYSALLAAYTPAGKSWIDALLAFAGSNIQTFTAFLNRHFPAALPCRHQAGTLLWVDWRGIHPTEEAMAAFFNQCRLEVDLGSQYGPEGEGFFRIQLGIPKSQLNTAMARMLETGLRLGIAKE